MRAPPDRRVTRLSKRQHQCDDATVGQCDGAELAVRHGPPLITSLDRRAQVSVGVVLPILPAIVKRYGIVEAPTPEKVEP